MTILYTIGHSNRPYQEFINMLQNQQIKQLVDLRALPKSRFVPWSNQKSLAALLDEAGMAYIHMPELGGMRTPMEHSINLGWKKPPYQAFADYMQTPEFIQALNQLNERIREAPTAMMCAEKLPLNCHRQLIADAELIRDIKVIHLIDEATTASHALTNFAVVDRSANPIKIYYPDTKNLSLDM